MSETCACGTSFVRTEYQPEPHCPKCGQRPFLIDAADYYRRLVEEDPAHQLEEALLALEALVDNEPCRFDHHGYCQSHTIGLPCPVAVARNLLRRVGRLADDPEPVMTGEPTS